MCLIVAPGVTPGIRLEREVFDYVYTRNNDGFGAMWTEDGRVNHFKTIGLSREAEWEKYNEQLDAFPDTIFHFRMRTHGRVSEALCHPFRILHKNRHGVDLFMMHNGVLSSFGSNLKAGQSDTTNFKDKILVPLLTRNPDALDDEEVMAGINKLTSGSRLIFLNSEGKVWRTSPGSWNDRYDLCLSNTYMLPEKKYVAPPTNTYSPAFDDDDLPWSEDDSNVITIGRPPNKKKEDRSLYNQYRTIKFQSGKVQSFWCAAVDDHFVRTENGLLFYDQGHGAMIKFDEHYVPKNKEKLVLSIDAYLNSPHSCDEEIDDESPAEEKGVTENEIMEQKLRYARLVHNTYDGDVIDREQLMADLLTMDRAEMHAMVREDSALSTVVMSELIDIVLEVNTWLASDPDMGEFAFDADRLVEYGKRENHIASMAAISDGRKKKRDLAKKAAEVKASVEQVA